MPGSVFASAITGTIAVDSLPVVSSASAGIVPMIGTATTAYLKGDLTWSTITGGGDMTKAVYDSDLDNKIAEAQLTLNYATHSNATDHSVDNVGQHGTATTGIHGVGSGTIAQTADIPSAGTTASTQAFSDSAAGGTATTYSKTDHKHAMMVNPVTAHGTLTTGIHGVGTGTIAQRADIADDTNL